MEKNNNLDPVKNFDVHSHYYPKRRTFGQKAADAIAEFGGSWTFIIIFLAIVFLWVAVNLYQFFFKTWDPYPFILLNLGLSLLAAIQAPVILMSQNRQAQRDRAKAERDYMVNRKAEREIEDMQKDLDEIKETLNQIKSKV